MREPPENLKDAGIPGTWELPGGSWEPPGRLLESLGATTWEVPRVPGSHERQPSGNPWEAPWEPPGSPWEPHGRLLEPLGAFWGKHLGEAPGALGATWEPLQAPGSSLETLGRSGWEPPGRPLRLLEGTWKPSGSSWKAPGSSWEPSGAPLEALGATWEPLQSHLRISESSRRRPGAPGGP